MFINNIIMRRPQDTYGMESDKNAVMSDEHSEIYTNRDT